MAWTYHGLDTPWLDIIELDVFVDELCIRLLWKELNIKA
jgi:hypothetical protein